MSSKKSPRVILPRSTRGQQSCASDLNTLGQVFFLTGNLIKLIKCWCENHLENQPPLALLQAAFSAHFIPRFAEPQCELARRQALTRSINGCSIRARPEQMKKAAHSSSARMQRGWTCFIFHSCFKQQRLRQFRFQVEHLYWFLFFTQMHKTYLMGWNI